MSTISMQHTSQGSELTLSRHDQAVAQPAAHLHGTQEVGGAEPPSLTKWVASSNGKTLALQARDPGSNPGASTIRRSSSNGQSARLRTGRLRDRTLRAAPMYRDRLIDRTTASEAVNRGLNPCPCARSQRSSTAERPYDMRKVGRSSRPAGTNIALW